MKREEKHALSIRRIQDAAMKEFAAMVYPPAPQQRDCRRSEILPQSLFVCICVRSAVGARKAEYE